MDPESFAEIVTKRVSSELAKMQRGNDQALQVQTDSLHSTIKPIQFQVEKLHDHVKEVRSMVEPMCAGMDKAIEKQSFLELLPYVSYTANYVESASPSNSAIRRDYQHGC
ncbi:hypothetical protein E0Z10_g4950 [Xylaria hypoxylon]|uniref:Uncharacterized protein n=1 Tax=Xylaria hypoxylon TaxID=37992 RepID=A0A4Z0Z2H6_9PEZI|nr:hypothetical protein E0Z10_g4950 [Xylaria hypoxylon]